ncbi:MAG: tRNA dihydrouridine synthase DusB [Chitinivibrionales bacterium]|nr:tRNA dihydrouridine synthase DusB [Chitinivibrionales bacterium]
MRAFLDFTGNKLFLAPMAGISETVFRSLCKQCGADVVMSEMVSAEGVLHNAKNTTSLLYFSPAERPFGVQLFGSNPTSLAEAAKVVAETAQPDFIDLNSGCPVPKVIRKNGGAALLRDEKLFEACVTAMVAAVSIPITVKIRSGWNEHEWTDTRFAAIAANAGAAAVIVHPRSKTMAFSGHSYWERIAIVKHTVSIPVIGNGDILTPQDAQAMVRQTGCDSIMIGRAALGNPWVFMSISNYFAGKEPLWVSNEQRYQTILAHLHAYGERYGEKKTANALKPMMAWYIKQVPGASGARARIFKARSTGEIREVLKTVFDKG